MTTFHRTSTTHQPGARTMAREYYTSPGILAEEDQIYLLWPRRCDVNGIIEILVIAGQEQALWH